MTKTWQENNLIDGTSMTYTEIEIELSWTIR